MGVPMSPAFQPFSGQHGYAVLVGTVITALLIVAGRSGHRGRLISTGILAFINLSAYAMVQAAWLGYDDPGIENILPFQLCDVAAVLAGFALLTRKRLLCELTYYWGLAATLQGLLTPALREGFPSWPFVVFFIQHFAVVAAALYLPLADGWRPDRPWWRSPWRALLWANAYLLFAMAVNAWLGSNFGFASRKPINPSILDHLGPWPWYLLSLQGLALILFLLLTLPFVRVRKGAK